MKFYQQHLLQPNAACRNHILKITEKEDTHEEIPVGLLGICLLHVFPGNPFSFPNLLSHVSLFIVQKQMQKAPGSTGDRVTRMCQGRRYFNCYSILLCD